MMNMNAKSTVIRVDLFDLDSQQTIPELGTPISRRSNSKWFNEKKFVCTEMYKEVLEKGKSARRFTLPSRREAARFGVAMTDMARREEFPFPVVTRSEQSEDKWYVFLLMFDKSKFSLGIDIFI